MEGSPYSNSVLTLLNVTHHSLLIAGFNPASYPDGKIPKELEGVSLQDYERNKMEVLLQVVSKWEREDV